MTIIENIKKWIEVKSFITIERYCCKEMKRFIKFFKKTNPEMSGVRHIPNQKGLTIRFDNYGILVMKTPHYMDTDDKQVIDEFTMTFCPFCGEQIKYLQLDDDAKLNSDG